MAADGRSGAGHGRRFTVLAALIALFALALRLFYIADAKVEGPIIGDINQYVLYAWNFTHFETFSSAVPVNGNAVAPDSYRGPGYPAFLAAMMQAAGGTNLLLRDVGGGRKELVTEPSTWITNVYLVQALLGAMSVFLTMFIARFWLSAGMALTAGLTAALWPHLVVFSAVMLSETLYGAVLLCGLWLLFVAQRRASRTLVAVAGFAFGSAYLINPAIALFPLIAAMFLASRKHGLLAGVFVLAFLVAPAGWAVRNSQIAPAPESAVKRIEQNVVQGSWPHYFDALRLDDVSDDEAHRILAAESQEERVLMSNPSEGLAMIRQRLSTDGARYARWYLLEKPFLLWDWGIRNGWGDVYFLTTERSPYERIAALVALKRTFRYVNPLFFTFAAVVSLILVVSLFLRRRPSFEASTIALLLLYISAVHVALTAEPRYAIPYRYEEVLLAFTAVVWGTHWLKQRTRIGISARLHSNPVS